MVFGTNIVIDYTAARFKLCNFIILLKKQDKEIVYKIFIS
jgi:hypothetical protein